jgi:glyoxylase-like metal-dependent hydrolase (beta-lactamase superfamily II)
MMGRQTVMRRLATAFFLACVTVHAAPVWSQESEGPPPVVTTLIGGHLHRLTCLGNVHAVASVGPDGILLVDTCYDRTAEAMGEALTRLGGKVRYIINTHAHSDHVGGNALLGGEATIIAHRTVRDRVSRYYALEPLTDEGLPSMLLKDGLTIHFNGETIRLIHLGTAHTDGDVVVHFTESGVACLGDLVFSETFPGADLSRGGNVARLTGVIGELIDKLPPDVTLIPSHGREYTMDDLRRYHEMMVRTTAAVQTKTEVGESTDAIVAAGVLDEWASWSKENGQTSEEWIDNIVASAGSVKPSICEPLSLVLVDAGPAAAVKRYRELKRDQSGTYDFGEDQLNTLGYELLARSMVEEAIAIFKLNIEAYPKAFNPYDSLGEAYLAAGETELAISNYERSLELNPDNNNAVEVLRTLRRGPTPDP